MADYPQEPAEQSFTIQEVRERLQTLQELSDEELDTLVTGGGLAHVIVNLGTVTRGTYRAARESGLGRGGSAAQALSNVPSAIKRGLNGELAIPANTTTHTYIPM